MLSLRRVPSVVGNKKTQYRTHIKKPNGFAFLRNLQQFSFFSKKIKKPFFKPTENFFFHQKKQQFYAVLSLFFLLSLLFLPCVVYFSFLPRYNILEIQNFSLYQILKASILFGKELQRRNPIGNRE